MNGGKDNDYTHDAPQNGYLVRKKVHPEDNKRDGNFPWRQAFLYRLASVYLDYAEALNEAYDDNAHRLEALEYVNRIRERAGVRQYTTEGVSLDDEKYIHVDDTKEAVRKVIRMERRVELCCDVWNFVAKVHVGWTSAAGELLPRVIIRMTRMIICLKCAVKIMVWIIAPEPKKTFTSVPFTRPVRGGNVTIGCLFTSTRLTRTRTWFRLLDACLHRRD